MRIIAVVVTFNRKLLLKEVLGAMRAQSRRPDSVVLVDNCSSDGTEEVAEAFRLPLNLHYDRLKKNVGGAGGFNIGMRKALELGADWLWCMDDDCIPNLDALEKLLNPLSDSKLCEETGFLASRVLWTDGSPALMNLPVAHRLWIQALDEHPQLTRIVGSSFVSMLVSKRAIELVGLPIKEFFVWFDDAEFSRRVSRLMPAFLVGDSVVVHKTPNNLGPLQFDHLDARSLWKYRYGIRNECSFHYRTAGRIHAFVFITRILRRMYRSRRSLRLYPAVAKACLEGLFFNYPAMIEFPVPGKAASVKTSKTSGSRSTAEMRSR